LGTFYWQANLKFGMARLGIDLDIAIMPTDDSMNNV